MLVSTELLDESDSGEEFDILRLVLLGGFWRWEVGR